MDLGLSCGGETGAAGRRVMRCGTGSCRCKRAWRRLSSCCGRWDEREPERGRTARRWSLEASRRGVDHELSMTSGVAEGGTWAMTTSRPR